MRTSSLGFRAGKASLTAHRAACRTAGVRSLEALAKQPGHLDEERPAVASESGDKLLGKRIEVVVNQVVVVTDLEGSTRAWCPSGQEL